jgi:streptomycin 6-kinase
MPLPISAALTANCRKSPERTKWLERLPSTIRTLEKMWSLMLGPSFDTPEVTASFVAPAQLPDGTRAILKIGMPHFEALHEIDGLQFWSGNPTIRLLKSDAEHNAVLLERAEPGTSLRELPKAEQDVIIAAMLGRLWRKPAEPHPFRRLSALTDYWSQETLAQKQIWPDAALVRDGLRLFHDLPPTAPTQVLLATDLHAGNILRSHRELWLVIDPKPFFGDPTYDVTQHLLNNLDELNSRPFERIHRLADLLELDRTRLQQWLFARLAADPRDNWQAPASNQALDVARKLAP